jgi:hypothetical protein
MQQSPKKCKCDSLNAEVLQLNIQQFNWIIK